MASGNEIGLESGVRFRVSLRLWHPTMRTVQISNELGVNAALQ